MTRCSRRVRRRKARKAAEVIAGYERLAAIEQRFTKIAGELKLLTWMVGFNLAATVGIIFLLLRH